MDAIGYSLDREKTQREKEAADGTDAVMVPREVQYSQMSENDDVDVNNDAIKSGRKAMTDEERSSDPDSARRGAQPKPSNPDGSEGNNSIT